MASPFTFFRKNQQSMMVVLVILAMLVFTLDSVFSSRDNQFVVLGLLLGGTIFAIAGIGTGRWLKYGAGGAVLGALCGLILPYWLTTNAASENAITSSLGAFDDNRIYDLQLRRGIADQFMIRATEAAYGQGMGQFATVFGYGHQSDREDVVFGELMKTEADELNIVVTDEMVSDYINKATGDKLTPQAFAKTRAELVIEGRRLSEDELFDILRDEIKGRMAFQMLRPQVNAMPPAPAVYYNLYRRLHVSQRLNTALIDVDAFLNDVKKPSDAEVSELFAKASLKFPNSDEPGSPGFRQPRKTKLAYLELDYKKVESSVPAVTDADVEAYYNENRDTLYRRPVAPDVPQTTPEAPAAEKPAETPASDPAAPAATDQPKAEEPKAEEPAEKALDTPASGQSEPGADCGPGTLDARVSVNGDEPATETPVAADPAPVQPAQTPATEASAPPAAPATGDAAGTPAAPATTQEPAATPAAAAATQTPAAASTDAPLTVPAAGEEKKAADPEFPEQKYEIRPLNDELKNEIRDQLLSRRVRELIEARMNQIMADMKKLESQRRSHRLKLREDNSELTDEQFAVKMAEYSPTINKAAKALASSKELTYVETPLVSYLQLTNSEDYPIGAATPPGGNPFAPSGPDVANTVFSAPGDELQFYRPRHSVRTSFDPDGGETHYAWWIIDNSESHVPTLDEPGIRDEVVLALKRTQARVLAQKRAEQLASEIRSGLALPADQQKPMATTLENATATGKPDSPKVPVRQTIRFTWMRQENPSQMNFMQQQPQAVLSQIEFADEAGGTLPLAFDDFMKAVFDNLPNNGVGVVPNADLSKYYLVQVIDRTPTPDVGEDALRQQFLTEGTQFGFGRSALYPMMQQTIAMPAVVEWEKSLWLKYGVDPDAPPTE